MSKETRFEDQITDFAEEFANFSVLLDPASLAEPVKTAAKRNIFDTLSCAIGGVSALGVPQTAGLVAQWGGAPEARLWCSGIRVPAHHAAWVNGMMAHARDFDDTHDAAVLHAGVSVIPAALAAAECYGEATGADVLAGVVSGLELICRMGQAATFGPIELGYIYTGLMGHFSATAAAARVARLNVEETVNALGIALSQAAGTHQVTRDAAWTKRMQPGFAAKTGLISVALTRAGIKGARRTFEGTDGFFRAHIRGGYDPERLREGLGTRFEFTDLGYKPYPCCRFNHTAIEAALRLRERFGLAIVGQIDEITARVNAQCLEAVGTPLAMRQAPKTVVQAQFSIPYTVACALVQGSVGLTDFTDEALARPDILALAARIRVEVDPEIERNWSRNISPTLLVARAGGREEQCRIDVPSGSVTRPMSEAEIAAKLESCVAASGLTWPVDIGQRLQAKVEGLEFNPSGADLVDTLIA